MTTKTRELSPAARHRDRMLAAKHAQAQADDSTGNATEYELKLMQLAQDKRDLSNIKGMDLKIAKKVELFPNYLAWCEGVLASDSGTQDDVLVTMLVWAIDIGNWGWVQRIAAYCIKHQLAKPDTYQRDIPNIVAEEVADAQIKLHTLGVAMQADVIANTLELVKDSDLFDQVRAKLHKAMGYALMDTDKPQALEQLKTALSIHDKVGVKKDIENLEREIRNSSNE